MKKRTLIGAVSSSIRVAGVGKREDKTRPRASQRFSIGLRSGEYAGHAIRAIPSLSRQSLTMSSSMLTCCCRPLKQKVGPAAPAYYLTMGSRTSSRYRTAVTETPFKDVKVGVWYPN
ncbi:hypothetical protein TNCV_3115841 [Trichonephila clavipes]|nr:hypothetical protein TNCV_3115841 [Trichonephila clavipes]